MASIKGDWTAPLMAVGIFGIAVMIAFVVFGGGLGKLSAAPGSEAAAVIAKAEVQATGGLCYDTDTKTSDINTRARQSLVDSTGAKQQIAGTASIYLKDEVTAAEAVTLTTGYGASTSDLSCGQEYFIIFTNSSYYSVKTDVIKAENVKQYATIDADLIATISVTGTNSSDGGKQSTSMGEVMGASETQTGDYLNIKANTARGVLRDVAVCFNYNTSNFTTVEVVGGTEMDVPSGIASGYEECWKTTIGTKGTDGIYRLQDYAEQSVQLKIVAQSGVNPGGASSDTTAIVATVIDFGTYTKAANGVLFNGYQNADTLADTGATNADFIINVF